jgi:ketosteroid isomerase-like protein
MMVLSLANCTTTVKTDAGHIITESEVHAFVAQYDQAWNTKDNATIKNLLSDDYLYFSSVGETNTKSKTLAFLSDTAYVIHSASRPEIEVVLHGNIATVNSRWVGELSWQGQAIHDNQRCGLTLVKVDGIIQIIAEHCVEIK